MNAGIARVEITPDRPICLAGYAARTGLSEGMYHSLYAKALVLEEDGARGAIVTSDLIGFDDRTCNEVKSAAARLTGFTPEQIFLNASHTHTGPEMRIDRHKYVDTFDEKYAWDLVERIAGAINHATKSMQRVTVDFYTAPCTLGVNRRRPSENGIEMRPYPEGPTDPEVTVLTARRENGDPLAVAASYACHPTTLGGYLVGADYPGFAQDAIEAEFPGCMAMFIQGCGGDVKVRHLDANARFKSGPFSVARSLGEELARAVLTALSAKPTRLSGPLGTTLEEFALPLQDPPTREEAQAMAGNADRFLAEWGRRMLDIHDKGGDFQKEAAMTVQTLTIGDFALVGLSGEACVGYALRLKQELADRPILVAGYTNGMIGYLPMASMLSEGGYEATRSHYYDNRPAPYAEGVEDAICAKVHELLV